MKKQLFIIALMVICAIKSNGQSITYPLDTNINVPLWVQMMGSDSVTYNDIKDRADDFFTTHPGIDTLRPRLRQIYNSFVEFWGSRSIYKIGDTVITNLTEIAARMSASYSPGSGGSNVRKWKELTPDESEFQNLGVVTCTWSNPADPNIILAGTESSGLWKTTDGGLNWVNITDSYIGTTNYNHFPFGIQSIAVHPNDVNTIYVAASLPYFEVNNSQGVGILKTTDGGNTWVRTNFSTLGQSPSSSFVKRIIFDPKNPDYMYAVSALKIYYTQNGFSTWQSILDASNTGNSQLQQIFNYPQSTYAGWNRCNIRDIEILNCPYYKEPNNPSYLYSDYDRIIIVSLDTYWNKSTQQLYTPQLLIGRLMMTMSNCGNFPITWENITNQLSQVPNMGVIMFETDNNKLVNEDNSATINLYCAYNTQVWGQPYKNRFCFDKIRITGLTHPSACEYVFTKSRVESYYYNHSYNTGTSTMEEPFEDFDYYFDAFKSLDVRRFIVGGYHPTIFIASGGSPVPSPITSYHVYTYKTNYTGTNIPQDEEFTKNKSIHSGIRSIEFHQHTNESDEFIVGTEGGISVIGICATKYVKNINGKGLSIQEFHDISSTNTHSQDVIIGGAMHNGFWAKQGSTASWENYTMEDGGYNQVSDNNPNEIIFFPFSHPDWHISYPNSLLMNLFYTNVGMSYDLSTTPNTYPLITGVSAPISELKLPIPPVDYDKNTNQIYAGFQNVYKTSFLGTSWTQVGSGLPANNYLKSLKIASTSPEVIYTAYNDPTWPFPPTAPTQKLYKLNGTNWADLTPNVNSSITADWVFAWSDANSITTNPNNPNQVWVAMSRYWWKNNNPAQNEGIYRVIYSGDGGLTWVDFSEGLTGSPVNKIICLKGAGSSEYLLIAATDNGVYIRDHLATAWTNYSYNLPSVIVKDIVPADNDRKIRIATWGRGIWEAETPCFGSSPQYSYVINPGQNVTINTPVRANSVYIANGGTLTITSKVRFSQNAQVTVAAGGKLIVDGGILEACPGEMWQGIMVNGNNSANQFSNPEEHGIVEMKNNAVVKDAICGIQTQDLANINYGCGILRIKDAHFINNQTAIFMRPFVNWLSVMNSNPPVMKKSNEQGYITNTEFTVNPLYHDPVNYDFIRHVKLDRVYGLNLRGCSYSNTLNNYWQGKGIESYASIFTVTDYCDQLALPNGTPCPAQSYTKSGFNNLEYGIYVTVSNGATPFNVKKSVFDNNLHGVYAAGVYNAEILANEFYIRKEIQGYGSPDPAVSAYGVYLDQCSGYIFEGNTFDKVSNANNAAFGLVIHKSGSDYNLVYNNLFKNIGEASVQSQGNNRNGLINNIGLELKCNDNLSNRQDFTVIPQNLNPDQGIKKNQGTANNTSTGPANNTFTHYGLTGSETDYYNEGGNITYFYPQGSSSDPWVPVYYTQSPAIVANQVFTQYSKSLGCPPKALATSPSLPCNPGDIQALISSSQTGLSTAKAVCQIWIDGGNTQVLQQEIRYSYPWEALNLYQHLIAESPYLSDQVLIDAINSTVLPAELLKLVLIANPQCTRSETVWNAVLNRAESLPDYMLQEILGEVETISQREILEANVSHWASELKYNINRLNNYYACDTTYIKYDSIIAALSLQSDLESKYERLMNELMDGTSGNYTAYLNDIENSIDPQNSDQVANFNAVHDFCTILYQLKTDGKDIFDLGDNEVNQLISIAESGYIPAAWARAVLLKLNKTTYNEPILGKSRGEQRAKIQRKTNSTVQDESKLSIHPNPADRFTLINYHLGSSADKAVLLISDAQGKKVFEQQLAKQVSDLLVNTVDFKSGVYTVFLIANGNIIQSGKLIKK